VRYLFALCLCIACSPARSERVFTSYDDYYNELSGPVFSGNPLDKPDESYSLKDEHGFCGEKDSCQDHRGKLGLRRIVVTTSLVGGGFRINGRQFDYESARLLSGAEKPSKDAPLYDVSVYVATGFEKRPAMICIQGRYMGSGRFRTMEVYVVSNPLGKRDRTRLFHLPHLHSSCLGIRQELDGSVSYPENSYITENGRAVGLSMKRTSLNFNESSQSRPSGSEEVVRFSEPDDPFSFTRTRP
jgi:hypothetical protein